MDLRDAGQARGRQRQQRIEPPAREKHAGCSPENRQDHAFRKKLANEPSASGAEGGANRNLAVARGGPGQEQVGQVRAGDEQDAADRAEEGVEHGLHVAHEVILHRHHENSPALV